MKGDEKVPTNAGGSVESRPSLLNPLYLLVCELAAARRLAVPPLGRTLKLDLGCGWTAELSTDSSQFAKSESSANGHTLCLHHDGKRMHMGPFSPDRIEFQDEVVTLLRAAIIIADASTRFSIEEMLLRNCAAVMADAGLGPRVSLSEDPLLRELGRAAELLQGMA